MEEQFSNKDIVTKMLPLSSEVVKRMLEKHVKVADRNYIQSLAYGFLEEAHKKAFTEEVIAPFKNLVKEAYPKYLEALYSAFDTLEAKIEGEGLDRERDVRCKELSLWFARYIAENPAHAEDDAFLDIISRELAGKFLSGMPRLDLELALDIITGSIQGHMDTAFKAKFGKSQDDVDLDDIDEILQAQGKLMKDVPKEV